MESVNTSSNDYSAASTDQVILISVYIIVAVVTVLGNSCVILAYVRFPQVRKLPFNMYILNLALSDLMVGTITIPYHTIYLIWPSHLVHVQLWTFLVLLYMNYLLPFVSVMLVIAMSVDRYELISRPVRYHQFKTHRANKKIITATWIFTASYVLFFMIVRATLLFNGNGDFNVAYLLVYLGGQIILPLATLVIINTVVVIKLQIHLSSMENRQMELPYIKKSNGAHHATANVEQDLEIRESRMDDEISDSEPEARTTRSTSFTGVTCEEKVVSNDTVNWNRNTLRDDVNTKRDISRRKYQGSMKAARNLIFFVVVYLCCWAPLHLYQATAQHSGESTLVDDIFYVILYLNSAINPFLYAAMSARYREALMKLFCFRSTKDPSQVETVSRFFTEDTAN